MSGKKQGRAALRRSAGSVPGLSNRRRRPQLSTVDIGMLRARRRQKLASPNNVQPWATATRKLDIARGSNERNLRVRLCAFALWADGLRRWPFVGFAFVGFAFEFHGRLPRVALYACGRRGSRQPWPYQAQRESAGRLQESSPVPLHGRHLRKLPRVRDRSRSGSEARRRRYAE